MSTLIKNGTRVVMSRSRPFPNQICPQPDELILLEGSTEKERQITKEAICDQKINDIIGPP